MLEELAAEVGVPTTTVAAALEAAVSDGSLLGVSDDRGKFIAVTRDELAALAAFVRRRGRVTQEELARECSRLLSAGGGA